MPPRKWWRSSCRPPQCKAPTTNDLPFLSQISLNFYAPEAKLWRCFFCKRVKRVRVTIQFPRGIPGRVAMKSFTQLFLVASLVAGSVIDSAAATPQGTSPSASSDQTTPSYDMKAQAILDLQQM